jgi:hypothetical protein
MHNNENNDINSKFEIEEHRRGFGIRQMLETWLHSMSPHL